MFRVACAGEITFSRKATGLQHVKSSILVRSPPGRSFPKPRLCFSLRRILWLLHQSAGGSKETVVAMSDQCAGLLVINMDHAQRSELKQLVEAYAIRSRQLSEAVATLGMQVTSATHVCETIGRIEELRMYCDKAGDQLFAFINQWK